MINYFGKNIIMSRYLQGKFNFEQLKNIATAANWQNPY